VVSRHFAGVLWVGTAVLVQLGIVTRLPFPLGVPNVALLAVFSLALVEGPAAGVGYGFSAGLLGDLLGAHTLGRLALVWTLAGYLAGLVRTEENRESRNPAIPMLVIGAGTLAATLAYAALGVVVGDPHAPLRELVRVAVAATLYNVLLTPFLYPPLRGLLGRLDATRA
jgi:rod shape-determining protein MreD